jgi:hypothetical protein
LGVFGLWFEFAAVVVEQGKTGAMGTFGIESLVVVGVDTDYFLSNF